MSVLLRVEKISKLYKKVPFGKFTPRQYMAAGFVVLALAAMLAIGFIIGRQSAAEAIRSCGEVVDGVHNSIANNPNSGGGCGALTPEELITDITTGDPDDQAAVMAHFGLTAGKYERFKNEAKMGVAKTDGTIEVDGKTVATDAFSIGRVRFSYSSPYPIEGAGNYFISSHKDVLQQNLPVMVLFDSKGDIEFAVLTSCGNPVKVKKKVEVKPPKKKKEKKQVKKVVQKVVVEKEKKVEVKKALPVTGPEGAAATFFGTSLAGAVGHRLYTIHRRKPRK